jgi:hypothetical protein
MVCGNRTANQFRPMKLTSVTFKFGDVNSVTWTLTGIHTQFKWNVTIRFNGYERVVNSFASPSSKAAKHFLQHLKADLKTPATHGN